ncbi:SPOSA6832_02879, partial [Sporobolomyces salmonicolor]
MASTSLPAGPPEAGPSKSFMNRMSGPSDLKAGLGGKRTAEEVQRIIYETSKESGGELTGPAGGPQRRLKVFQYARSGSLMVSGVNHIVYADDQQRRDKEVEARGNRLQALLASRELTANGREEEEVDRILEELEEKRDLSRVIALIDAGALLLPRSSLIANSATSSADAFYANVHEREDPSLAGKAFGVGGGMLTTASYEARKYGCRSAMPLFVAKKLCPHLISLKLEPKLYVAASREIMAVLENYGPISPASLDEACKLRSTSFRVPLNSLAQRYATDVDMTDYCEREQVSPSEAISRLRQEVFSTTGLTVSAGVSPNKALSKICADINKPNGQFIVDPTAEACMAFIKDVRLRRCYGIGRVTETVLNAIGLETVGDIYTKRSKLYLVVSYSSSSRHRRDHLGNKDVFKWLLSLYLGLGSNRVRGNRKTYGVEKTFHPTSDREVFDEIRTCADARSQPQKLRRVAKSLAKDLARSEFSGRTITLCASFSSLTPFARADGALLIFSRIKHDNFESITRAHTPGKNIYIQSFTDIYRSVGRCIALAAQPADLGIVLHSWGLMLLHKEMDDRRVALVRGEKVKGGTSPTLKARLLGLRVGNLRDERKEKTNKIDGWFTKPLTSKNSKEEERSDSDDESGIERCSDESGEEDAGEEDGLKRQLEQLKQAALAPDPGRGGRCCGRQREVADTDDDDQKGGEMPLPARTGSPKASTSKPFPLPSCKSAASSSSKLGCPPKPPKRKSPEPLSSTSTSICDAAEPSKRAKKKNTSSTTSPPPPPNLYEFTCPVCAKVLHGSETAMNGHVANHFEEPGKGKKSLDGPGGVLVKNNKPASKAKGKRKG